MEQAWVPSLGSDRGGRTLGWQREARRGWGLCGRADGGAPGHGCLCWPRRRAGLPSSRGLSGRGSPCGLCPPAPALRDGSPAWGPAGCKQIWPFCSVSHVTEAALLRVGTEAGGGCLRGSLLLLWPVSPPFWGLLARVAILTLSPAPELSAWPPPTVQRQSAGLMRALGRPGSGRALSQSSPPPLRLSLLRIELSEPRKELTAGTVD